MQSLLLLSILITLLSNSGSAVNLSPTISGVDLTGLSASDIPPGINLADTTAAEIEEYQRQQGCIVNCVHIVINCISGEMEVEERIKGNVKVSQLSEGDVIRGITGAEQKSAWCLVEAIFQVPNSKNQTTYDGFTADHMVINGTVRPYGKKGEIHVGPVYTLATDCDASVNSAGQAFTPISTAFCPHELSWSEYLSLMSAIRRFTNRAGNFWYDLKSYHDNETAVVPRWADQLPAICRELLLCSREDRCQEFENVIKDFVQGHVNKEYVEIVERVFPNMGGDVTKQQAGTITEVVRPQKTSHIVLFSVVGSAMVTLLIIAVAILIYRALMMKKKKTEKELEPKKAPETTA